MHTVRFVEFIIYRPAVYDIIQHYRHHKVLTLMFLMITDEESDAYKPGLDRKPCTRYSCQGRIMNLYQAPPAPIHINLKNCPRITLIRMQRPPCLHLPSSSCSSHSSHCAFPRLASHAPADSRCISSCVAAPVWRGVHLVTSLLHPSVCENAALALG